MTYEVGGCQASGSASSRIRVAARRLQAGRELVRDFATDARREASVVCAEEAADGGSVVLRELAERPRHGLDDHVVAVVDEERADGERAGGVAVRCGRAARAAVERDGGDE